MKKKTVALLLACVMALGVAIGGTMAWLTDKTPEVTNTFTIGDIEIKMTETKKEDDTVMDTTQGAISQNFHFVPGQTLNKDPKVTVLEGSEACWLFVQIEEKNNNQDESIIGLTGRVIQWEVDSEWIQVPGTTDVWYIQQAAVADDGDANTVGVSYQVLTGSDGGQVTVNSNVDKTMVEGLKTNVPTLTFNAYAIQSGYLKDASGNDITTAAGAWEMVKPTP